MNEPEYELQFPVEEVILEEVLKITLHDLTEYTVEDFILMTGGHACLWCNGYLLAFEHVTPEFYDRTLNNGVRWYRSINYSIYPEYTKTLKTSENVLVPLINYSNNKIGQLVVKFIDQLRKDGKR